jgi:hypothetical protein
MKQNLFSKRSAWAFLAPAFSDPAIGWEPIKLTEEGKTVAAFKTAALMLPTSLIKQPGFKKGAIVTKVSPILSTGVAMITRSASFTESLSEVCAFTQPRFDQKESVEGECDQHENSAEIFRFFAANKMDPPIKPAPTTEMRLKCNIFNIVWF